MNLNFSQGGELIQVINPASKLPIWQTAEVDHLVVVDNPVILMDLFSLALTTAEDPVISMNMSSP